MATEEGEDVLNRVTQFGRKGVHVHVYRQYSLSVGSDFHHNSYS